MKAHGSAMPWQGAGRERTVVGGDQQRSGVAVQVQEWFE